MYASKDSSLLSARLQSVVDQSNWMSRAKRMLEDAFANVSPKPSAVYNARYDKAPPIFEKHRADYDRLISQGANVEALLDGIYAMAFELERQRATATGNESLDQCHQELVEAECASDALQLRAARTGTRADCDAAIAATVREVRVETKYLNKIVERSNTLALVESQVGYARRSIGKAS